ncbi:MAG: hydrogenase maturation protease [Planctomycetes bacterium]|nr:hydrogenase maturation protease [Planctomycetota bacterium]
MSGVNRRAIVIGWGNRLRRDDALAHFVLAELGRQLGTHHGVVLMATHQLDPTMAEAIASHDLVVFVDAALGSEMDEPVKVEKLAPPASLRAPAGTHVLSPSALLAMAQWLYGREPEAALVTMAGHDFSFGEGLSRPASEAVPIAVEIILRLLHQSALK